jgi:hypothetical protein
MEELLLSAKVEKLPEVEGDNFSLSNFMLERMKEGNLSIRMLSRISKISPTIIQKMRTKNAENINYRTLLAVLSSLGYKINIEEIPNIDNL